MAIITRSDIEQIQHSSASPGFMLSCYADLTVKESFDRHWIGAVKHAASLIRQSICHHLEECQVFQNNYQAILETLENPDYHRSPGMAIFAARQRNFFKIVPLPIPVHTEMVYCEEPYLVPLLQAYFSQQRQYLALAFDNKKGSLFSADVTGVQLLNEWDSDIPKKHHASGERGGWSQPKIASHREELLDQYYKEIVAQLETTYQAYPESEVILLGHESSAEQLKHRLPQKLQERVVAIRTCSDLGSRAIIDREIRNLVKWHKEKRVQTLLDELDRKKAAGNGVAMGARGVIEAIDSGKLGKNGHLMFGHDPREVVLCCPSCRFLSCEDLDQCPRCGSECKSSNLWEELLLRAMRHGWKVEFIESSNLLSRAGGVALLYDHNISHCECKCDKPECTNKAAPEGTLSC